jgi:hypothetical protein
MKYLDFYKKIPGHWIFTNILILFNAEVQTKYICMLDLPNVAELKLWIK